MSNLLDKWVLRISLSLLAYILFYIFLLLNHDLKYSHFLILLSPITIVLALSVYSLYYIVDGAITHSYDNKPLLDLLKDISVARKSLELKGFKFPSKL